MRLSSRRAVLIALSMMSMARPVAAVEFVPGVNFDIPPPSAFGGHIDALQIVTARHGGDSRTFEARLSVTSDSLLLVATDSTGRRLMTINWHNGALAVERAPGVPDDLKPENIVMDIVFMYWPPAAIRGGLGIGGSLAVSERHRTISANERELVTITYDHADPWTGLSRLRNHVWNYEIEVRSQVIDR